MKSNGEVSLSCSTHGNGNWFDRVLLRFSLRQQAHSMVDKAASTRESHGNGCAECDGDGWFVFRVRACRSLHEVPSTSPHLLHPDKIRVLTGTRSLLEELPNRSNN